MVDRYDWSSFATQQSTELKVKEQKADEVNKEAVEEFVEKQGQTLREIYHYEDPELQLEQKVQHEIKEGLREAQDFVRQLRQEGIDLNRPDWHLYVDPVIKGQILEQAGKLKEINERMDQQQERLSRKELTNQAQPGFKAKPQFQRDQELAMRVKQAVASINAMAIRVNPSYNPKPGTGPGM